MAKLNEERKVTVIMEKNSEKLPNYDRGFFPKVTASLEQKQWVYGELLPALESRGLITNDSWAEFIRWAINVGAQELKITPPKFKQKSLGKRKASF